MNGIIVLEGADSSGKTMLARHLVEAHGAANLHSTVRRDTWRWHVGALRLAIRRAARQLVVMDRHWISEMVYGAVFRGGPAYDVGARCMDRVLRRYGALYVLAAPLDQRRQEERWVADAAHGKREHFNRVREVITLYADLRDGNVAHPGDGYLDQLIRFQDFTQRDDVLVYDMDGFQGPKAIRAFTDGILLPKLNMLKTRAFPADWTNISGRADATRSGYLFVGEALSPRCDTWAPRIPRWPWCDNDRHLASATWLNQALHHLTMREDRMIFTNAIDEDNRLPQLLNLAEVWPLKVIALGNVAADRIERLGHKDAVRVMHPQAHRRFHHHEGPEGYADMLRKVMG